MTHTVKRRVIEFHSTRFGLDGRNIIGPLEFAVQAGEILVLLGRSGSGKTTTLRLINGLLRPTDGSVLVDGLATTEWQPVRLRRSIGYVIQEVGLFPHMNVRKNVGIVPTLERWERSRVAARVDELLQLVGLPPTEFAERLPHELSGGQRQRVGVARALAVDPPILLCDEPFGAVDPITRAELQREFAELSRRLGKTVVFVTHDVREALRLGDRIALFEEGLIRFLGTSDDFRRSDDDVVRSFGELV
jgi:osmoprotectant transport system ATP-binding protein